MSPYQYVPCLTNEEIRALFFQLAEQRLAKFSGGFQKFRAAVERDHLLERKILLRSDSLAITLQPAVLRKRLIGVIDTWAEKHLRPVDALVLAPQLCVSVEQQLAAEKPSAIVDLPLFREPNAEQVDTALPVSSEAIERDEEAILADLFDLVKVPQLEKMFPDDGRWASYAEHAKRIGLIAARAGRSRFNPYRAAVWWLTKGPQGWDLARCKRVLVNNLPARSRDSRHLLTGELD